MSAHSSSNRARYFLRRSASFELLQRARARGIEQRSARVRERWAGAAHFDRLGKLDTVKQVVAAILLWHLARITLASQGARVAASPSDTRLSRRNTDLLPNLSRAMMAIAIIAPIAALSGFVPLSRYILFAALSSLAMACTALFLFRSLTEGSALLFTRRGRVFQPEGGNSALPNARRKLAAEL